MSKSDTAQARLANDARATESDDDDNDVFHDARFPADEEAELVNESHAQKSEANKLFASSRYSEAISSYDRALSSCPNYLDYEIAVLRSNIAACHLKLDDWKAAVEAATSSIECLDRALPAQAKDASHSSDGATKENDRDASDGVVEIDGDSDEEAEQAQLEKLRKDDQYKEDVRRIRAKALVRRARARSELGGWANLQGAEEDYKELVKMDNLPPRDRKLVQKALVELPARIQAAREEEMGEMMGKLKDLGNGILKPFGLSTENFQFVKDEKTGGYSVNFTQ